MEEKMTKRKKSLIRENVWNGDDVNITVDQDNRGNDEVMVCMEKQALKMSEEDYKRQKEMNIIGWESASACANDVWNSIHSSLLSGNLIFAYKSHNHGTELGQIIIVQNINQYHDFAVGMMTTGFTSLLPHVPWEYLDSVVTEDLKKYKVESSIRDIFKQIIEEYRPK